MTVFFFFQNLTSSACDKYQLCAINQDIIRGSPPLVIACGVATPSANHLKNFNQNSNHAHRSEYQISNGHRGPGNKCSLLLATCKLAPCTMYSVQISIFSPVSIKLASTFHYSQSCNFYFARERE